MTIARRGLKIEVIGQSRGLGLRLARTVTQSVFGSLFASYKTIA